MIFSIKSGIRADKVIVSDDVIYFIHDGSNSDFSEQRALRLVERSKVGMRAHRILRDNYFLSYDDGFMALYELLKCDKKFF